MSYAKRLIKQYNKCISQILFKKLKLLYYKNSRYICYDNNRCPILHKINKILQAFNIKKNLLGYFIYEDTMPHLKQSQLYYNQHG